jgi:hypothetical protein
MRYRLKGPGLLPGGKNIFVHNVQTGSDVQTASYAIGAEGKATRE